MGLGDGWEGNQLRALEKKIEGKKTRVIITKGIVGFKRLASLAAIPSPDQTGGWLALIRELLFLQSSHIHRSLSSLSSPCCICSLVFVFFSFFIFSVSYLSPPQQGPLISPPSSKTLSPPDTADRQIIKHNRFCLEFVSCAVILAPQPHPFLFKNYQQHRISLCNS